MTKMKRIMNDSVDKLKDRVTSANIKVLKNNEIFVFGSNMQGVHTGGAACAAIKWGAVMGQEKGLQGNTYAIPTTFKTTNEIEPYVSEFIQFAESSPEYTFLVTEIGCGLAGYETKDIAPLFKGATGVTNICLPYSFWEILDNSFSERLKFLITYYSISLADLGTLDLTPSHVINLLLGEKHPTVFAIQKILIRFPDVNARWLLLGEGSILGK